MYHIRKSKVLTVLSLVILFDSIVKAGFIISYSFPNLFFYYLEISKDFLRKFIVLVNFLIPLYEKEGKSYLTIGVGCTGGKHRSVAVINSLEKLISKKGFLIRVLHRDLGKT